MKTFGNIIWHVPFMGFLSAIFVYFLGTLLTLTVVAAPIGLGLMELGKLFFAPFGKVMIKAEDLNLQQNKAWKTYSTIVMVLYWPFGALMAIVGVIQVAFLFVSVIGIPVGLVIAKALGTYLNPVGKKCVSTAIAAEIERRKAVQFLSEFDHSDDHAKANALQALFCPECGKKNPVQAKFCGGCGESLPEIIQEVNLVNARPAAATRGSMSLSISIKQLKAQPIIWLGLGLLLLLLIGLLPFKQANKPAIVTDSIESNERSAPIEEKTVVLHSTQKKPEPVLAIDPMPVAVKPHSQAIEDSIKKPASTKQQADNGKPGPSGKLKKTKPSQTKEADATTSQTSSNQVQQSSQSIEQHEVVQPTINPSADPPKKQQGLRWFIQQTTGVDPGDVSGATEHQCTDAEKMIHANGC